MEELKEKNKILSANLFEIGSCIIFIIGGEFYEEEND